MEFNSKSNWHRLGGDMGNLKRPRAYSLPADIEMTPDLIQQYIDDHKAYIKRFETLQKYYEGWAEINEREERENKANNKVANPYPKYITDIMTGMFVGKPVAYSASKEEQEGLQAVLECFNYNDEQDENMEIAKMCSIKGEGYELVYLDKDLNIRFNELDPEEVIYITDNEINPEPLHAIRYIEAPDPSDPLNKTISEVTHYSRDSTTQYVDIGQGLKLREEPKAHFMGQLPVVQYTNNNERQGDFEQVLPLINAYNKACSDDLNYIEEFVDAILVLTGMANTDSKDAKVIFEDKILLAQDGQDAKWLTKNMSAELVENTKTRLDNDIHKFAFVPNLGDERFAGNVSGEAMKYKLMGIRQILATKERKFKRALQRRLELIIAGMKNLAKTTASGVMDIEYTDINITFKQNIPINEKENVEMVKTLSTLLSEQSALAELYCVEDPTEEISRKEEDIDRYMTLEEAKAQVMQEKEISDEQG